MRRIMITIIVFQAVLLRIALSQSTTEVASVVSSAAIQSNSAVAQSTVVISNGASQSDSAVLGTASLSNGVTVQLSSVGIDQSDSSQVNMASMTGSIINVQPTVSVHQSSIGGGNAPSVSAVTTNVQVTVTAQPTTAVANGQSQSELASAGVVGSSVNSNNTAVQASDTKINSVAASATVKPPVSSSVAQASPISCPHCHYTNMTTESCKPIEQQCEYGEEKCTNYHFTLANSQQVKGKGCAEAIVCTNMTKLCQYIQLKHNLSNYEECAAGCCPGCNSEGYIAVQAANSVIILLFALSASLYSLV